MKSLTTLALVFLLAAVSGQSLSAQITNPEVFIPHVATVHGTGPIFLLADAKRTPLIVATDGTKLRVLDYEGEWYQVEFDSPYGRRTGYIQRKYVDIATETPVTSEPAPAARSTSPSSDSPVVTRKTSEATSAPAVGAGGLDVPRDRQTRRSAPVEFKDAQLRLQEGDKTTDTDAKLQYDLDGLIIAGSNSTIKKPNVLRALKYDEITGAEYTFGKSPRVSAALLVSPSFRVNSSKSHWLTVKTGSDYALLRLDKSNYKLVIAELEKRSGIKVESVGENK
ncbi:MAG: hypothetical protein C5B57_03845 [Blastocatellia bacterium]|nr:MAG: hypothetical protein C5B57_03845 [Blastocatellia bacterium]